MIRGPGIVRAAAFRVAAAAERTLPDYAAGRVQEEPDFTSRMLGRIAEAMDGYESKDIRWTAQVLSSHGRGSQEARYGADFLGVFEAALPG